MARRERNILSHREDLFSDNLLRVDELRDEFKGKSRPYIVFIAHSCCFWETWRACNRIEQVQEIQNLTRYAESMLVRFN